LILFKEKRSAARARRHFTVRRTISRDKRISQIPQGIYFVEKSTLSGAFFMAKVVNFDTIFTPPPVKGVKLLKRG